MTAAILTSDEVMAGARGVVVDVVVVVEVVEVTVAGFPHLK